MVKKLLFFTLILIVSGCLAAGGALYYFVAIQPGEEIKAENINKILGKESPVLYSDGTTRLGVFFDEAHRQYVPYDRIPLNFINALVASEDNKFFSHIGFDILGIIRAAIKNVQARRIVQGGSTLTQQTAKNLFKRTERSIRAKLKELLFALRLEYHYSKEEIFEFYANQFYVSGNGHGLGVAARYYFDKKPEELSLLECAYIAGSVKRPNYYNPFIKKTTESASNARKRGRQRVNYVLKKMHELNMISDYEFGQAKVTDVQFNKGQVGYALDYVMEMVRDAVSSTEVVNALEQHDITNISTTGVKIVTTVEKELQEHTLYALRHELSRLDTRLRGYERNEVQEELSTLDYKGDRELRPKAFLFGVVDSISEGENPQVSVFFSRRLGKGIIDRKGLTRIVTARVRWQKNPWSELGNSDVIDFLDQLQTGDTVWVSVRNIDKEGNVALDLEKFPLLNGGALVVKDGRILSMAGGVENRFFNRAVYARRTMGSSFKPFVYSAAVQLGWNSIDHLKNNRNVFVFQGQPYFPRPDHHSPYQEVSMSWAGVKSENVASVWLLAHLCDKLTKEQFREVAAHVNMAPRRNGDEVEPYSRFRSRIRDRHGIVIDVDELRRAAFKLAVKNVETDLIFEGRDAEYSNIKDMHYGLNFESFKEEIEQQLEDEDLTRSMRKELQLRLNLLQSNYLELEKLHQGFVDFIKDITSGMLPEMAFSTETQADESSKEEVKMSLFYDIDVGNYHFLRHDRIRGGLIPIDPARLYQQIVNLDQEARYQFWQNVILGTAISVHTYNVLNKQVARELEGLKNYLPYSMNVLENIPDYRVLVGLKYLITLARELEVHSDLEPVLSFPLGSNVVTLLEALRIYEGLATGIIYRTGSSGDENNDLLTIIDRIESADGEVLYRPERKKKRIFAPQSTLVISHILENVVKHGTGRYADTHLKLTEKNTEDGRQLEKLGLSIPVLGKTGTANRYTNAAFLGFLPGLNSSHNGLVLKDGFAVGVYVGFDDNKAMRKGATRLTGAAGALPTWTEIMNSIVDRQGYASHLDAVDLSFNGLAIQWPDIGQKNVAVSKEDGIAYGTVDIIRNSDRYRPSILTFGEIGVDDRFRPERQYLPYWRVEQEPQDAER